MKKFIKRKVRGYVITFEVMCTLALMVMIMNFTLYCLTAFDTQRYMSTVLSTTTIEISKWGGTNNNATVMNQVGDIIGTAQNELNSLAPKFNPVITGGPNKVTNIGEKIWCELEWTYPGYEIWPGMSIGIINKKVRIEMEPLMKPGGLL